MSMTAITIPVKKGKVPIEEGSYLAVFPLDTYFVEVVESFDGTLVALSENGDSDTFALWNCSWSDKLEISETKF